jgi:hypothetical protein
MEHFSRCWKFLVYLTLWRYISYWFIHIHTLKTLESNDPNALPPFYFDLIRSRIRCLAFSPLLQDQKKGASLKKSPLAVMCKITELDHKKKTAHQHSPRVFWNIFSELQESIYSPWGINCCVTSPTFQEFIVTKQFH